MATARNEITGSLIKTKGATDSYRSNWDAIFGKKDVEPVTEVEAETEEVQAETEAK